MIKGTDGRKVLVLLSGGIDSTACISYYHSLKYSISALHINYGQGSASKECSSAKNIANYYNIHLDYIIIKPNNKYSGYIPARNSLLLDLALMHFPFTSGFISMGIHAGTTYGDCTYDFVQKMQGIFNLYADGLIRIDTPFINWYKGNIFSFCKKNNVPIHLTYSCELGKKQPCGICLSCKDLENFYALS